MVVPPPRPFGFSASAEFKRTGVKHMGDVISLQSNDPEAPDEEKASNVSYTTCNNSYQSQAFCWRW